MLKSETLCEICEQNIATHTCKICGAKVCNICYDIDQQICSVCKDALCQICNKNLSSRACNICGRLVCEDCSIKEGESTICKDCYHNRRVDNT